MLPSGEKAGQIGTRDLQPLRRAALRRDKKQLGVAARRRGVTVGTEEDVLAVGRPAEDDVVGWMIGQALRLAAFCGDDVHVGVAFVLAGEGDPFSIWRKFWENLVAHVRRQSPRRAALARGNPQVAGVGKNHPVLRNIREAKQPGRAIRGLVSGARWRRPAGRPSPPNTATAIHSTGQAWASLGVLLNLDFPG